MGRWLISRRFPQQDGPDGLILEQGSGKFSFFLLLFLLFFPEFKVKKETKKKDGGAHALIGTVSVRVP
jgi:hypothetical protein